MTKRVNNINYKGINHSPSLVSDNDGTANECVNLSPDNGDLKPMPLPVKMSETYIVTPGCTLVYVHRGVDYENFVEINSSHTRLYFRDSQGEYLYTKDQNNVYWSTEPESEVIAIQSIGDTLVVSTKNGTEYLPFRKDVPPSYYGSSYNGDEAVSNASSYKSIGQKPKMASIEFMLHDDDRVYEEHHQFSNDSYLGATYPNGYIFYKLDAKEEIDEGVAGLISTIEKKTAKDNVFIKPFFIRYSYRMRDGNYIMHSPPVLMLPSTSKQPFICSIGTSIGNHLRASVKAFILQYKIAASADLSDWSDIIDGVDVFITEPIPNYDINDLCGDRNIICTYTTGGETYDAVKYPYYNDSLSRGESFVDELIVDIPSYQHDFGNVGNYRFEYDIKSVDVRVLNEDLNGSALFHKISSLDINEIANTTSYKDLGIDNISNLSTLPTLPDEYNSHCAIYPTLMQTYNSRLNMANISQKVFGGFANILQQQSKWYQYGIFVSGQYNGYIEIYNAYFRIKKNGKTFVVLNDNGNGLEGLDYTTYLYYPDPDCYGAVVKFSIYNSQGTVVLGNKYLPIPMKRHEYLNGSYWYDNMYCLGQYVLSNYSGNYSNNPPDLTPDDDAWYKLSNRFMMSAVGNPWYFSLENMAEVGRSEIRALAINTENMDAYQYGKNPIYTFSADGIWTINIKDDGSYNSTSYVSGDVIAEMTTLFRTPTASAEQSVFFKTARGISVVSGNTVNEIDHQMKGRVFNPKTKLLPTNSVLTNAVGVIGYLDDLINYCCDDMPYSDFAAGGNLIYDYFNKRLLLHHGKKPYMYVFDVRYGFWSKMLLLDVNESTPTPAVVTRSDTSIPFVATATAGAQTIMQDGYGYLWYVGNQPDENNISERQCCFYVSRPTRFGTDDYKSISRIVHNKQIENSDTFNIAIYGSRDGNNYYRCNSLRGLGYKFFVMVLYFYALPSSRYAYTAFEWEPRLAGKIR